ncbi:MAG: RagB/SusD family nutrient uptake outer membrane protein [Gemmatimonadaceae bacterium]
MRSLTRYMRNRRKVAALLTAVALAGGVTSCTDLEVTNPRQSSDSFWRTSDDAQRGLTAVYNALELLGVFGRWQAFANDIRSDLGTAQNSPWGDLANFNRFELSDYNFEVNRHIWYHNYDLIGRANLVTDNVPGIEMDATLRSRIVGEAKFMRALAYYNIVTLYENIPLVTETLSPEERPATAAPTQTWAQIEQDLVDAAAALPETYPATEAGRATRFAALAMLGKARLQQGKWAEASQALGQVIASGRYSLLPNYADNFVEATELRNTESLFEVGAADLFPTFVGISFPKMIGPCYRPGPPLQDYNPTFCDGRPTRWYFDQFMLSRTTTGGVDPRLDVTILYNDPARGSEMVYNATRASYFVDNPATADVREDTMIFFRKYGEHQIRNDQRWDNPINYRVIRYADVLLMQAEALNEQGGANVTTALQHLNTVRRRASLPDITGVSGPALRDIILRERMFEFGLESSRWNDLARHNLFANLTELRTHDPDFSRFVAGKSERLPIPTNEVNLNPSVSQNPGW